VGQAVKYLLFAGALLVVGHCQAQQVFKCVNGKDVSYQSQPCEANKKIAKIWFAPPEPPLTDQDRRRAALKRQRDASESAYLRRLAGREGLVSGQALPLGAQIPVRGGSACAAAKQNRDATLMAAGINRTHDLLRALDNAVYEACK
jgi:hypothetical protein